MEGSRTYPTDQVTGDGVDWIVPRSTANPNTDQFLHGNPREMDRPSERSNLRCDGRERGRRGVCKLSVCLEPIADGIGEVDLP